MDHHVHDDHKERLDAALLRRVQMDVQVEMSYYSYGGFKVLASTYLQVKEEENMELFGDIEGLLKKVEIIIEMMKYVILNFDF